MSEQAGGGGAAPGAGLGRLTESEQKLVAKLLSDPTFFPIEFRTWLKQFIEGSGIIITASQIQGGQGTNIATGLPAGVIIPVAAAGAVPVDCLICDGSVKVRTDYPILFERIGVAWGAGDGSTTFNIPDLRDRALYGAGGAVGVAQTDGVAFGSRGGPAHKHYFNQTSGGGGSHSHSVSGSTGGGGGHQHTAPSGGQGFASSVGGTAALGGGGTSRFLVNDYFFGTNTAGDHSHSISGSTSSDGSHSHNVQGDTSGGGAYDKPSFAGVIYVISIGTAA
jgi:microcystin-dependent protein